MTTTLTSLPRELRQNILLSAVQQETHLTINTPWPQTITSLLAACKLLRADMPWVLNAWSPLRVLQHPRDVAAAAATPLITIDGVACNNPSCQGPLCLCLRLYHDVELRDLWADGYGLDAALVDAWHDAVAGLPLPVRVNTQSGTNDSDDDVDARTTSTTSTTTPPPPTVILLDVTPAPGWMRAAGHANQLNALLQDTRTARRFLDAQALDVARLVRRIYEHYGGGGGGSSKGGRGGAVEVKLTGKLARRSGAFVAKVDEGGGVRVEFVGEYVEGAEAGVGQLERAVRALAPKKRGTVGDCARAVRLARLRRVEWSKRSAKLVDRACDGGGVEGVRETLGEMAELMVDERRDRLEMAPSGNLHRAMVHSLAQDMGMLTGSEGEGEGRFVVVTKKPAL
ncbi:uncharacterized protein BKCO1_2700068 [Diplodia corticola]|uniref:R3H domain-containing protein n=1 Tax=Diplodia corticola TaxID=236234 RepID=A0A1J9S172_9PEZI|nr:uncharacterized protein BKCO1_2700068 [Diplodia corticola]OJD33772.1 hypothetical protein BKCO1_2700068 [Diplodia corticola]